MFRRASQDSARPALRAVCHKHPFTRGTVATPRTGHCHTRLQGRVAPDAVKRSTGRPSGLVAMISSLGMAVFFVSLLAYGGFDDVPKGLAWTSFVIGIGGWLVAYALHWRV